MRRLRTRIASVGIALTAGLLLAFASANAEPPVATSDFAADWAMLPEALLDGQRGGAEVVTIQESTLESTVSDNSVGDGVLTGTIIFNDSFRQNSGIQSSMINSGNNVSMQSSMTVSVYLD